MTARGKLVFTIVFLGLVFWGVHRWKDRLGQSPFSGSSTTTTADDKASDIKLAETQTEVPRLAPPAPYKPKGDVIEIELSQYAGYAGFVAANGGLEPNENSVFFKKHGFKVKLTLSEEESWSALNSGKMAASATTVDVLAVYGRQFQVVVPAQIGFSRGADGVVVRSDVHRINDLQGKILAASQFTESDFFIRYLAQEAGLAVNPLPDLRTAPDPEKVNLVYCQDAFVAGDTFLADVQGGGKTLAGCVTWDPKTSEVASASNGKARVLITNTNLLVIADIFIVNKGFADASPDKVEGLVDGLMEGNRMVNENPDSVLDVVGKAFKWDRDQTKKELAKVHLANGPENLAFFSGAIDAAGSFGGIYQSAIYAYGSSLIKNPVDSDHFVKADALQKLDKAGTFAGQQVSITPIRSPGAAAIENDPLLSKNIRFLFDANVSTLNLTDKGNLDNLAALHRLLQVSPGSTLLLRGHVDNAQIEFFRKQGGEPEVRRMALRAVELSKERANEIKRLLVEREKIDPARLDTVGRGWEEPLGTNSEENRRVEAQWFTVE